MNDALDWVISTAEWAKLQPGTFLTIFALVISSSTFFVTTLLRSYFFKYRNAIERWKSVEIENEELHKIVNKQISTIEKIDPTIFISKIQRMSTLDENPSQFDVSEEFFREMKDAIAVAAYINARNRRVEFPTSGVPALLDAERFLRIGLAADPQNIKIDNELKDIGQMIQFLEKSEIEQKILSINDLQALTKFSKEIFPHGYFYLNLLLSERILKLRIDNFGRDSLETFSSLNDIAHFTSYLENHEESKELYEECIKLGKKLNLEETPDFAVMLGNYAGSLIGTDDDEYCEEMLKKVLDILKKSRSDRKYLRVGILHNYARLLSSKDRFEESEKAYSETIELVEKLYGKFDHRLIACLFNYGTLLERAHRHEEAREVLLRCNALNENNYAQDSSIALKYRSQLFSLLARHFPGDEAINDLLTHQNGIKVGGGTIRVEEREAGRDAEEDPLFEFESYMQQHFGTYEVR